MSRPRARPAGDAVAAVRGRGGATKVSYLTGAWHLWRTLTATASSAAAGTAHASSSAAAASPTAARCSRWPPVSRTRAPGHRQQGVRSTTTCGASSRARCRPRGTRPRSARRRSRPAPTPRSRRPTPPTRVYQLCDTTSCQVYGGRSAEVASTNKATAATAGQVRTYQGSRRSPSSPPATAAGPRDGGKPYLPRRRTPTTRGRATPPLLVDDGHPAAIEKAWPALGNLTASRSTPATATGSGAAGSRR